VVVAVMARRRGGSGKVEMLVFSPQDEGHPLLIVSCARVVRAFAHVNNAHLDVRVRPAVNAWISGELRLPRAEPEEPRVGARSIEQSQAALKENRELKSEVKSLQQEVTRLNVMCDRRDTRIEALSNKLSDSDSEKYALIIERDSLKSQLQSSQRELKAKDTLISRLEREVCCLLSR
jgi:uncharacterized protein (DUF3084 family)